MSAYWIALYREISDPAKVAAYAEIAGPAIKAGGGRFVVRGLPEQVYEAGVTERCVVIEFDSVEAARATHDSDEYARALEALGDGAVRDMRIAPGTDY
ncbi:hypothetical protein GCM10009737_13160 [Nocardioides lentus]|uniref:DUF1330 domain-containing protein n=1 Tax=Nocardioides lentus TaxID=338077 RepID=A0ABP5AG22_9ACTN